MSVFKCECCDRQCSGDDRAKNTGLGSIKICVRCNNEMTVAAKAHKTNGGSY